MVKLTEWFRSRGESVISWLRSNSRPTVRTAVALVGIAMLVFGTATAIENNQATVVLIIGAVLLVGPLIWGDAKELKGRIGDFEVGLLLQESEEIANEVAEELPPDEADRIRDRFSELQRSIVESATPSRWGRDERGWIIGITARRATDYSGNPQIRIEARLAVHRSEGRISCIVHRPDGEVVELGHPEPAPAAGFSEVAYPYPLREDQPPGVYTAEFRWEGEGFLKSKRHRFQL